MLRDLEISPLICKSDLANDLVESCPQKIVGPLAMNKVLVPGLPLGQVNYAARELKMSNYSHSET